MKYIFLFVSLFFLYGCWFVILPIGPIVRAIQGPRYCVGISQVVGDRIKTPGGKWATITKLQGEDTSACKTPIYPILANVTFDEEKNPEEQKIEEKK